jgi:hypothetical protein
MTRTATPGSIFALTEQLEELGRLIRRRRILEDMAKDYPEDSPDFDPNCSKALWLQWADEGIAETRVELQMEAAALKDGDEILTVLISKQVDYARDWSDHLAEWLAQRES